MSYKHYHSITEDRARSFARQRQLHASDVSELLNIQIGEYADFELTETEIRRVKMKQSDYRPLFPEEKAEILSLGKRLHLDLPCTPRSLVAWAERNHYFGCLPASFLEELGKRSLSRRTRGRRPISDEVKECIKLAAMKFLRKVPPDKLREWSARKVAFHADFVRLAWPGNQKRLPASASDSSYRQAYGIGLRTVKNIISAAKLAL